MEDCSSENSPIVCQHQSQLPVGSLRVLQPTFPKPQQWHHHSFRYLFQPLFCNITKQSTSAHKYRQCYFTLVAYQRDNDTRQDRLCSDTTIVTPHLNTPNILIKLISKSSLIRVNTANAGCHN